MTYLVKYCSKIKRTAKLISKDSVLEYFWEVSTEGAQVLSLGDSKAGGGCNSRNIDVDALLDQLMDIGRPFKTSDVAKILGVGCKNTAGFVIAALVNEGLVEQLPSQTLGKQSCPRLFHVVRQSKPKV